MSRNSATLNKHLQNLVPLGIEPVALAPIPGSINTLAHTSDWTIVD